jgi:DNA-binding protein HU-beta
MKKADFTKAVAEKFETTQKEAVELADKFFEVIKDGLLDHGEVPLGDLGKLSVVERKERNGVNPQTKESIVIPATRAPKFKPSKLLKDIVK